MNLKEELQHYIENSQINEKVIKSSELKSKLSKIYQELDNSNKSLKIKANLILFTLTEIPKCECGNTLKFTSKDKASIYISKFGGWREFCSRACMQKSLNTINKRQETNVKKYGEISYTKTKEFKDKFSIAWSQEKKDVFNIKSKETSQLKYGVDHYSKTEEYLQKRMNTSLQLYGVENTFQLLDRVQNGQKNNFGNDKISWLQTDKGKEFLSTNNPMSNPETARKSRFSHYIKNWNFVREDFRNSIINQDKDTFVNIIDELFKKYNKERLEVADELQISYSTLCRYIRGFNVQDRYISPRGAPSINEREIYDFVKELFPDTQQSNRSILENKKEIDIFVPSKNLGIEYDSLYYHSEYSGLKDSLYHLEKTNICESKEIQLLHIFEPEWNFKKEIVKSIIKNKLGVTENKIYARKCSIRILTSKEASKFLNENHLSGFRGAKFHHGLIYNNKLVSVMSIGEESYSKNKLYEITRFASILNTNIVGGMSKLFHSFTLNKPIISYSDRRYSSLLNSSYSEIFDSFTTTDPCWWGFHKSEYILNHRLNYTKNKLKLKLDNYDSEKDPFDNMIINGYDRILDCGNIKFFNKD